MRIDQCGNACTYYYFWDFLYDSDGIPVESQTSFKLNFKYA